MQYRSSLLLALLLILGSASFTLGSPRPTLAASTHQTVSATPKVATTVEIPSSSKEVFLAAAPADTPDASDEGGAGSWLLWLIPLVLVGAVAWGLSRRRSDGQPESSESPAAVPPPPPTAIAEPMPEATEPHTAAPTEPGVVDAEAFGGTTPAVASPNPDGNGSTEPASDHPVPPLSADDQAVEPPTAAPTEQAGGTPPTVASPNPDGNGDTGPASGNVVPPQPPSPPKTDNGSPTSDMPPTRPGQGAGGTAFAGAAGLVAGAAASMSSTEDQSLVEARKYNVVGRPVDRDIDLSNVDDGLPELPGGYGESRIVLMPRDPEWAYVYWDIPNQHKAELRRQGGSHLALRLYDVTGSSMQQYDCDELARSWYLRIPISDRDYRVEIGYLANDGRWLLLASSNLVRIPPVYPSSWEEDLFATVDWGQDLEGSTLTTLVPPDQRPGRQPANPIYAAARQAEAQRLAGSLYGSMQHVPGSMQQAVSSYGLPTASGIGMAPGAMAAMAAVPTASGMNVSGLTMSGVGFSASAPPIRPRQFWLVADAELIVYGATEPDASVTVGGYPVELQPDGTFRFHMSFQDGNIDYPIMAVAADGEQSRSIHMTFDRETPQRRTNTKAEAQEEWPGQTP